MKENPLAMKNGIANHQSELLNALQSIQSGKYIVFNGIEVSLLSKLSLLQIIHNLISFIKFKDGLKRNEKLKRVK